MKVPQSCFFVANEGQWEEPFSFKLSAGAATYFVTQVGMTIDLREYEREAERSRLDELDPFERDREPEPVAVRGHVLKVNFVGGNSQTVARGEDKLASYSNYFLGRDSCKWRSRVGHYQRVIMEEVWNGIDVEFRAQPSGVETVYRVKPGADPSQIVLEYEGLDAPLHTDSQGNLILSTSLGNLTEKAPWAYQVIGNRQQEVRVEFQVIDENRCALNPQSFDRTKELVIDPLLYSTYWLGEGTISYNVKRAQDGDFVAVGETSSVDFPATPGAYQDPLHGASDAMLLSMLPDGTDIHWATYIGGNGHEEFLQDIEFGPDGTIYAVGTVVGGDWPITAGAFDTSSVGPYEGVYFALSADGTQLDYSSFIGGSGIDFATNIVIDSNSGEIIIGGSTENSGDFYFSPNAIYDAEDAMAGAFLAIFDPDSNAIDYSTLIPAYSGGTLSMRSIFVIGHRRVWMSGRIALGTMPVTNDAFRRERPGGTWDNFFTLVNMDSGLIEYGSYLGGNADDDKISLNVVADGRLYFAGSSRSSDIPTTPDAIDTSLGESSSKGVFLVLELPNELVYSTYFGMGGSAYVMSSRCPDGTTLLYGSLNSDAVLPVTPNAFDPELSGPGDGFLLQFDHSFHQVLYCTYLGGSEYDGVGKLFWGSDNSIWLTGGSDSQDFPTTEDAYRRTSPGGFGASFLTHLDFDYTDVPSPSFVPAPLGTARLFPNPVNGAATIELSITTPTDVAFVVYNLLGQRVTSYSFGRMQAGLHKISVDLSGLPSGRLFGRCETSFQSTPLTITVLR